MRHHLNILLTLLQGEAAEPARRYIKEIGAAYDETIIERYSRNEMINSVISIYQMRFSNKGFTLRCEIRTGETLHCPDLAICTILSNAFENAMHSLENLESGDKWTRLSLTQKDHQLLLKIENPVDTMPRFIDGIPASCLFFEVSAYEDSHLR